MSQKKQVTYDDINSFIISIKCCNVEEIKKYLEDYDSIIVNRLETQTRQPCLFFAASLIDPLMSYEIMKLLIDNGANPHFKDNYEQTVLFYVCRDGKEQCLDLLLEKGLDLNSEDIYGQTPIYYVAKQNRLNIIHKLIEKKVDLNKIDKIAGQTPLFYAAKEGHLEMCKILIESGCDLSILDNTNKMAAHTAKRANKTQVFEYLSNQFQALKEQKKIVSEIALDSHCNQEEKSHQKSKKKKQSSSVNVPRNKSATSVYKLYRSDAFGNINEVTSQQFEELITQYPNLQNMMKKPEEIDLSELEEIKAKTNWIKAASRVLTICHKARGGSYFHEPVDQTKYGIDDYFDVIEEPMDLGTIRKKLDHNMYSDIEQFIREMNLVFDNCLKYNGPENMVAKYAIEIKGIFEDNLKQMGFMN